MSSIRLVWAQSRNAVIGRDGLMPWHLPEDMKHFRQVTSGTPVLMGRRTWDSLPERFRPLPGRRNIVVTRQNEWQADGAEVAYSIDEALDLAGPDDVSVIGGRQIYDEVMPQADVLEVTEIDAEFEGDTYAPQIPAGWLKASVDPAEGWHTSSNGLRYRFVTYRRSGALTFPEAVHVSERTDDVLRELRSDRQ